MSVPDNIVQRRRSSLLAVVLGLVLLASTGVAAWIVSQRGGAVRNAVEILAHIRQGGLPAFWGDQPAVRWYLALGGDGRAVGWWMARRQPIRGGYAGADVEQIGSLLVKVAWQVDDGARTSQYVSQVYKLLSGPGIPRPVPQLLSTTRIRLQEGLVKAERVDPRGKQATEGPAAADYIPEGLSDLAFLLAASGGRDARFAMIADEQFVGPGGELAFKRALVSPRGPREARVALLGSGEPPYLLRFDQKGEVIAREPVGQGLRFQEADFKAVLSKFPDVRAFARPEEGGVESP